jgi:acetyl-CoA C-acetyltransferase
MTEVVIASACRTPVGKFQGAFASLTAPQLGAIAIREAVARAGIAPAAVEECIMGCVLAAGVGQNPARQAAIHAGLPPSIGSFTVNKVCGSGLKSVMLAAQAIRAGDADVIVAGGMESMTNAPYLLPKARDGYRLGHGQVLDSMVADGLWDVYEDFHMGNTAELVAEKYGIGRDAQDEFAAESHRRAMAAIEAGAFDDEIVAVEVPQRKGDPIRVTRDEGPRADSTAAALAKLRPAFVKTGSVTAGNASSINDGAAAFVVMSAAKAKELGVSPLTHITGYASGGTEPKWVMMAPVEAVKNLGARTGVAAGSYDLVELNEAFSVQAVACTREIGLDPARVNVHGGAVALGHPIGASGARVLTTLLYALRRHDKKTGLASLCIGGGNAVAMSVERC